MSLKEMKILAINTEEYEIVDEKARPVESISEMKGIENLKDGDIIKTIGYYSANDGGGATYLIREKTWSDTEDLGAIHFINDTLVAEMIISKVNVLQFGAKGNGIEDDTERLKKALKFAKDNNLEFYSPSNKTYLINDTLIIDTVNMNFNNSKIITNDEIDLLKINSLNYYGEIKNIILDCNSIANSGINIVNGNKKTLKNIVINNVKTFGINYQAGYEIIANNIHINGNENSNNAIGLNLLSNDSHWTDIIMININTGVYTTNKLNFITRLHAWNTLNNVLQGSKFIRINGECYLFLEQCYSDTYQDTFYLDDYDTSINSSIQPMIMCNELSVQYNESFYNDDSNLPNPNIFKMDNYFDTGRIFITNSIIRGLKNTTNVKTQFSTSNKWNGIKLNTLIYFIDEDLFTPSIEELSSKFTAITNEIKKDSSTIYINGLFSFNAEEVGTTDVIGYIPYNYVTKHRINFVAFITDDQWGDNTPTPVYMYLDPDSRQLQVSIPKGMTGTKYLHINHAYVI